MSLNLQKCEENKRGREYVNTDLFRSKKSAKSNHFLDNYHLIHSGISFQMSLLAGMSVRVSSLGMQASHRKWRKFCCSLTFVPHKFLTAEMRFVMTVATGARENPGQLCRFYPQKNKMIFCMIWAEIQPLHTPNVVVLWYCWDFTHSDKFYKKTTQTNKIDAFTVLYCE